MPPECVSYLHGTSSEQTRRARQRPPEHLVGAPWGAAPRAGAAVNLCLAGLVAAVRITSLLGMAMLRNTFVTSVARFTLLHSPGAMAPKNAQAFRAMLVIADENGNHLGVRA